MQPTNQREKNPKNKLEKINIITKRHKLNVLRSHEDHIKSSPIGNNNIVNIAEQQDHPTASEQKTIHDGIGRVS